MNRDDLEEKMIDFVWSMVNRERIDEQLLANVVSMSQHAMGQLGATHIVFKDGTAVPLDGGEAVVGVRMYANPPMPPMLDGETDEEYTNRLTGADGLKRVPYKERRFRQCRIGWHDECSDSRGEECECPCHVPLNTETEPA